MANPLQGLSYNKVTITSLDGKEVDLTNSLLSTDYFEDILEPCVSTSLNVISGYDIVEGLPIRGGERVIIDLVCLSGRFVKQFRVYKVSNISTDKQKTSFTLNLSPDEHFNNELTRCVRKYEKLPVNQHVRSILQDVLKTNLIGIIEETSNSYSFIGNTKKPFHTLQWLGPKSISRVTKRSGSDGKEGTKDGEIKGTAGFVFYQNKDGFNFRSIDSLASRTRVDESSADDKDIQEYTTGEVLQANRLGAGAKIIEYYFEKNIDLRKSLRVGMYSSLVYNFNPANFSFSAYRYNLRDELKSSEKMGSEGKIKVLDIFGETPSRVYVQISDQGVLQKNGGEDDSGRDRGDYAKSFARYNLLFTQALNILVPCNLDLKVGDIIRCSFPELKAGKARRSKGKTSGLYLIKELRHHFEANQSTTSLRLVRDSYGYQ